MAQRGTVGNLLVQLRVEMGALRADLQNVERTFAGTFSNLQRSAASLGKGIIGGLLAGFSVSAVTQFTRGIVNLAGELQDLSEQTGISAQTLSGIKSTLDESGSSIQAFATGLFKARNELAGVNKETDPAALAVKRLGLSLDDLNNADTDTFLKKVTDALAKVENPVERNRIAFELFGKQARELIPSLLAMTGRLDELRRQGISDENIRKLDEMGDAFTRFGNTLKIIAAGPLVDIIEGIERLFGLSERARLTNSLIEVEESISRIDSMLKRRESLRGKGLGFLTPPTADDKRALDERQQLLDRQREIDKRLNDLNAARTKPTTPAPFRPLAPPAPKAAAGGKSPVESFFERLQKQARDLESDLNELVFGKNVIADLNAEFAAIGGNVNSAGFIAVRDRIAELTGNLEALKAGLADQAAQFRIADDETAKYEEGLRDLAAIQDQLALESLVGLDRELAEVNKRWDEQRFALIQAAVAAGQTGEELDELLRRLELLRQQATLPLISPEKLRPFEFEDDRSVEELFETRRQKAVENMQKMFSDITNSISQGIHQTVIGIQTGQLTLSEGLNNMFRNALLSVSETILDKAFLDPLKGIVNAFFAGFAEVFAEAGESWAEIMAKQFGTDLGKWLKEIMSSMSSQGSSGGGGGFLGWLFGAIGGLFKGPGFGAAERGGFIRPGLAFAGLPQFAMGGAVPIIAHGGEYVINKRAVDSLGQSNVDFANRTGKWPKSGASKTDVIINGDITPRRPEMTPEQVIQVVTRDLDNRGPVMNMFEQRTLIRGTS